MTAFPPAGRPGDDAEGQPGGRSAGGELVLIVDDEGPVRAAARRILEHAGYKVVEAQDVEDALLRWVEAPPDIVVTDFMMPGLNGVDLLMRLRSERPDIPALIVSGYIGDVAIDADALGPGTSLLQKPFSRTDLLQAVRALLDRA